MRILFIADSLAGGGRERRLTQLLKKLSADSVFEIYLVLLSGKVAYHDLDGLPIRMYDISGCSRQVFVKRYKSVVREFRPSIVHCWSSVPWVQIVSASLKLRFGYRFIAGFVADANPVKPFSSNRIGHMVSFGLSDLVISNSFAGLIAKKAPSAKSRVIYNGFDYSRFSNPVDPVGFRKELGVPQDNLLVGMIARFDMAKDWNGFFSLAEMSLASGMPLSFLSVGDGPTRANYMVNAPRNVHFMGFTDKVDDVVRILDIGILLSNPSSHAEGFSNAILEMMAASVPVLAYESGGTTEVVASGKNGFLVAPGDINGAFDKLSLLSLDGNLRLSMGSAAGRLIREKFCLEDMVDSYISEYHALQR